MSTPQIINYLINALYLTVMTLLLIKSIRFRKKTKVILDEIIYNNKKRLKDYEDFVTIHNERLNLLSKENVKVRRENEELKDRLRNVGINDFDVI